MKIDRTAVILYNKVVKTSPEDILDILPQAKWVSEVLTGFGFTVLKLPFSLDSIDVLSRLKKSGPIFVFNMVDSAPGEENYVYLAPFILDSLGIKYTGCSAETIYITTNKVLTKQLLGSYGLPTPGWVYGNDDSSFIPGEKYIIKALCEDASIGLDNGSIVRAETKDKLAEAIAKREAETGKAFFAERYIDGREFDVCIYGSEENPVVLPPYEWIFKGFEEMGMEKFINYDAKWTDSTYEFKNITDLYNLPGKDAGLIEELKALSETCWRKFRLKGYVRLDYRIDSDGKPWILEINTNPSLYGFWNVAKFNNLDFNKMMKKVVEVI